MIHPPPPLAPLKDTTCGWCCHPGPFTKLRTAAVGCACRRVTDLLVNEDAWRFTALWWYARSLSSLLTGNGCISPGRFREPDLVLLLDVNDPRNQNAFWLGADLVVEIVSPDHRERDTSIKRTEYAEARIPEYWIVNPEEETITVLKLTDSNYVVHGIFRRGDTATSSLLQGFTVSVHAVCDAE